MSSEIDGFSQFEHEGWQRIASKYEDTWAGLTRSFIPHLLEAVELTSGTWVLDVACGPGYVAQAANQLGTKVVGVDFSAEMIRLAQARSPQIDFREGDAQALAFEDSRFDAVVMNFGVLHLSNPEAAFSEAHRVLNTGGRYGFTLWAEPEVSPGAKIVEDAVQAHADMNVDLPKGPDYFGYGGPDEYRLILGGLGFDPMSLVFNTVTVQWQVPTASFLFEAERDAGVRTAALLKAQTPKTLSTIQGQIEQSVLAYAEGDHFVIPFAAHVVAVTAV